MKFICNVCGKEFKPGNNPISGNPNGIGFPLKKGGVFNICEFCVCYRAKEATKMIEEMGGCK